MIYAAVSGIDFPAAATLMVGVSIPVLTTDRNGMPDKLEADLLVKLEEQLQGELHDGVFVGRLTGGVRRELYFYTSPSTSLDDWLSTTRAMNPDREFRIRTLQDQERIGYQELRDDAARAFVDVQTLQALERQGADLTKKHDLRFYLYFPTEEKARAALGQLELEGWLEYQGWAPEVRESGTPESWLLLVTFIGYRSISRGTFPLPVVRVGSQMRVPRAAVDRLLAQASEDGSVAGYPAQLAELRENHGGDANHCPTCGSRLSARTRPTCSAARRSSAGIASV